MPEDPPPESPRRSGDIQTETRASATPRTLLSEIGTRLAQALRDLRTDSSIRESLEEVIEDSARQTLELSPQERMMLSNLLKFGDLKVEDVMVPRADIVAVEEHTSFEDLLAIFRDAQHSRLPLYRVSLDDPIGMIHVKDVINLIETDGKGNLRWKDADIASLKRDVLFVPGAMPTLDLLMKMQASHIHIALVVDEYGGTAGVVTIEDLVEEIVGDIEDEHDVDESHDIKAHDDGSYDADARAALDDFKERTGIDLTFGGESEEADVDTLGGLVLSLLGRVPVKGEIVTHPSGYAFEVLEADKRLVRRLRVRPVASRAHAG